MFCWQSDQKILGESFPTQGLLQYASQYIFVIDHSPPVYNRIIPYILVQFNHRC